MRPSTALTRCLLVVTMLAGAPHLRAQTQAENVAAARTLGTQGIKLADEGDCPGAIEKLERAVALHYAPTMMGRLGECQVQVGQIVQGTENLNRVVREQLAPGSPQAFRDAQARARRVLEQATPRIAYLVLNVGPPGVAASVTVGKVAVPAALLGAERPTDPGTHEVVATAPGYVPARTTVSLAEGARQEITLTLSPDPSATPANPAPPPASEPVVPAAETTPLPAAQVSTDQSSKTLAYVLLGVGGVGLAGGAITGLMAISKKNDLDCPDDRCPPAQHDDLDSAKGLALVSTIGFGVGVAGAAVGTVLLLTSRTEAPVAEIGPVRARPFVGKNSVGFVGSF